MIKRRIFLAGGIMSLAACGGPRIIRYDGPPVTGIHVEKGARRMALYHEDRVLKRYRIELGFNPVGHKQFEGDGKTPEGLYRITHRNPDSRYHLSIGISYPNQADRAFASRHGRSPGGDIFIHGTPERNKGDDDWTAGCIAVTNDEMNEIYSMVRLRTVIQIDP